MKILPAIDLRHGHVVQLVGGDPANVGVAAELTPAKQAAAWQNAGASMLHVVDLDGALGEARQWPVLHGIQAAGLPVQFGGGVRNMIDVQQLLDLGVKRIIIGTQGIQNPEWLAELSGLFPGKIVLAIDAVGRDVAIKGWQETTGLDVVAVAKSTIDVPLAGYLYTNVAKEGRMQGIDADVVRDLRAAVPDAHLIISGGVHNLDDLATLSELGVDAVVLGMSIYTGAIDLRQAIEQFEVA